MLACAAGGLLTAAPSPPIAVADDSVNALSEAYNSSGQDLFSQLAASPGNIVFSPYSVGTALALALSGARGETEAEMARVLRHSLPRAEVDGANSKAIAILNQYGRRSFFSPSSTKLMTANAVMLAGQGHVVSNEYLARAKANYSAEIFRDANLAAINDWVGRKTEGKIDKILEELDPNTAAVLLNAIYFKAQWGFAFDRKLTRTQDFAISPSQKVSVPFMHRDASYPVVDDREFSAIRLPYNVPQLHMVIVLPSQSGVLDKLMARLDSAALAQIFARLQAPGNRAVHLALPRFKSKFEMTLKEQLGALGMKRAFDTTKADFSGMTNGQSIMIKDIHHQAVIEVAEEGTEAAAATAVIMLASGPRVFRVNHPFLFYIIDAATNAILFQGRIVDPS